MFVAWPSLSSAIAPLAFGAPIGWLPLAVLLALGAAALAAFALAPRLAERFVRTV